MPGRAHSKGIHDPFLTSINVTHDEKFLVFEYKWDGTDRSRDEHPRLRSPSHASLGDHLQVRSIGLDSEATERVYLLRLVMY